jgi:putative SOS response-associated peptidase YedK
MCNRVRAAFEFREVKIRWDLFNDLPQFKPIYNVAPGRKDADILAIVRADAGNEGRLMYWPLIPSFEKSMALSYSTMNAKIERLRESRVYQRLLDRRRCIIPVEGFYEWQGKRPPKTPWFVYLKSKEHFAFAGFWDTWKKPDGNILESFSIVTGPPNDFVRNIHDRMPAILRREDEAAWLDCAGNPFEKAQSVLKPFPSELMAAHITSTRVSNPRYNEPDCGAPETDARIQERLF